MRHFMFDIDGTLIQSYALDETCFIEAVESVLGQPIDSQWERYTHVTDEGILQQYFAELGMKDNLQQIRERIKHTFLQRLQATLATSTVEAIPGANNFLNELKQRADITVSIATGGWRESAELKLASAGIDTTGIPIATSNDHITRTAIMRIAQTRAGVEAAVPITYFGDAPWDQQACKALGFKFVLVGDRINHQPSIPDYTDIKNVMAILEIA